MIIIGERINGMFRDVKAAVAEGNGKAIQDLAQRQIEAGARILDVNVGTSAKDQEQAMKWLVEAIQEVTDLPLAIDSSKPPVLRAGLSVCKNKALINSTSGEPNRLKAVIDLAVEFNADIVGLTMDEQGIPSTPEGRAEIGMRILVAAMEAGMDPQRVYLDPVVLPVTASQDQCKVMLETLDQLRMLSDPPPKTVVGLSNVSQGSKQRPLINRTYLVMCLARGLDAAVMDPFDRDMVDAMITSELLLNRQIYSESFLSAYRKSI